MFVLFDSYFYYYGLPVVFHLFFLSCQLQLWFPSGFEEAFSLLFNTQAFRTANVTNTNDIYFYRFVYQGLPPEERY